MAVARRSFRRQWARRVVSTVSTVAALAPTPNAVLLAQRSTNNHWRTIDAIERDIGGLGKIASATGPQIQSLTDQLLLRGQFYQDLADFEAVLTRDHARFRDSVGKAGGRPIPAASYYRGRGWQELGFKNEAAQAYRALPATAPANIRALATAWSSTLAPGGPRSWQQDIVDWRNGQPKGAPSCPADSPACALFKAIKDDDIEAMDRLQRSIVDKGQPADFRISLKEGNDPAFAVQFFDPLVVSLLAATDYAIAANLLKGRPEQQVKRGVALLRIGRVAEATPLLKAAAPYYGEALFRSGARSEAEAAWKGLAGGPVNVAWDVKSALSPDAQGVMTRFRADSAAGLNRMRQPSAGGISLARALLRHQLPDQALTVLESVVPAGESSDFGAVLPSALVLIARARYEVGSQMRQRDLFPLARGPIAAMARELPIIQSTLDLLQQVTMPPNIADVRTR